MKSSKGPLFILIVALMTGCSGGGGSSGPGPTSATLVSILVIPLNASISIGTSKQFAATGTYSDHSTKDLTTSVTWTSSDTSVAMIGNTAGSNGNAASIAEGTTTITATLGSISDFTRLKVTTGGSGITGSNVLSITVNGSLCSAGTSANYPNKPCVSVTICSPGTSTCQTIDDILLDTGSFGLRIFKQVLTVSLTPVVSGSGSLAECAQFGDGSSEWGPVQLAGVTLASEPMVMVPIQVIDSTFANISTSSSSTICPGAEQSPAAAGFNGILGVGIFRQDCGSACTSNPDIGIYYSCTGSTCSGATVALSSQVQNPVALLPQDNNGVIVELPSVSSSGAPSVSGSLVLGIGTQTNNVPSGVTAYATDGFGEIITTISITSAYSAIIDTGSNGYFFTPPSAIASQLPDCASNPGWLCPSTSVNIVANNAGASGVPSGAVSFEIGNFTNITSSNNKVFSNIGGNAPGTFDWGLPFFFGRNVYVGIDGKGSGIGSGPYWAY